MNDNKEMLGTAPIGKLLFKLAVPTVVAQLINMLYNIVDRIYIGHIKDIGSLALTGVGVCMPIIMIISAFAALIASGGAPKSSICMGKGDNDSAERIMGGCLSLQLIISAILTAVLLIWNKDLLLTFGASENTIGYATDYMNIYAIGTVFVQLTLGMGAFITAQGYTKISMITVLIGAVSNIILDPIFIFGFNMGVKGAALATILSQAISCIWVLLFLCGKKTYLKLKKHNLRIDAKLVFPCIALGTATFILSPLLRFFFSFSLFPQKFPIRSGVFGHGGTFHIESERLYHSRLHFPVIIVQYIQSLIKLDQPLFTEFSQLLNDTVHIRSEFSKTPAHSPVVFPGGITLCQPVFFFQKVKLAGNIIQQISAQSGTKAKDQQHEKCFFHFIFALSK